MKKILSLMLVGVMMFSMIPAAYATNVYENPDENTQMGTAVEANGSRTTIEDDGSVTHNVEYTITVPAKLAPAGSGTVTLEGMWPSDATVKVTADPSVEMVNSINSADKKTLAVTFTAIELAGNNTVAVSDDETVSVADISAALFGTWSGTFHYNVDYVAGASGDAGDSGTTEPSDPDDGDGSEVVTGEAGLYGADGSFTSWESLIESGELYIYNDGELTQNGEDPLSGHLVIGSGVKEISAYAFSGTELTCVTLPDSVTKISSNSFKDCLRLTSVNIGKGMATIDNSFAGCTNLNTINYAGTTEEWAAITVYSLGSNVPATQVICSDGTVALS